jgi:hypothetical protein
MGFFSPLAFWSSGTIEAALVEAILRSRREPGGVLKTEVKAPTDYAIVTGWKVCTIFHTFKVDTNGRTSHYAGHFPLAIDGSPQASEQIPNG